jgi:3-oxosteroid 1-dehydrogenase
VTVKILARTATGWLGGRRPAAAGAALAAQLLKLSLEAGVVIAPGTGLDEIVVEDGRVTGVVARREGESVRLKARLGVVLAAGGFAKNDAMRAQYGPAPATSDWSAVPAGDTGDAIRAAVTVGAATEGLDGAWWVPSCVTADGNGQLLVAERSKPYSLMVDGDARRYINESAPYVPFGQAMYEHNKKTAAVPSWFVMDSRYVRRYAWGAKPPGWIPRRWLKSGYFRSAATVPELAARCGLDPEALTATVERFNRFAAIGIDEDFHKGESPYDRYYGDPTVRPNPCLGAVAKAPFYAVQIYPGDGGTAGGIVTDAQARVLDEGGSPIEGLYGCGNTTASVVAHTYPGPGATIGPAMTWGFVAGRTLAGRSI